MTSAAAADVSAVSVHALRHRYPPARRRRGAAPEDRADRWALDGVSFDVAAGQMFAILGPNGSGKSTLFRILTTLLRPTEGSARIFGDDVVTDCHRVRRHLGVVFQMPSLDVKLTAAENMTHQGQLYGLDGPELAQRSENLLAQFGLDQREHDFVESFSGGMRRKVELAKAMLHEPRLLLLDEPSTGLDPGARADLWRQLEALRVQRGVTIVLTTHLMDEADRCDRLAVMNQGKLVALDTPANLKRRIGGDVIRIEPKRQPGQADLPTEALADLIRGKFSPFPADGQPRAVDGAVRFELPDGPRMVAEIAAAFPEQISSITVSQPTLEDVFVHLTGQTL